MFRCIAAGPKLRSRLLVIVAMSAGIVASGCELITPANYIAQPRIQESRTPVCYRHASRLRGRCDRVEYFRDEDVRNLLTPAPVQSYRSLGAVR